MCEGIPTFTDDRVPFSCRGFAAAWAEAKEGCLDEDFEWSRLAPMRCRLLLSCYDRETDFNTELKRRLKLWEKGKFTTLAEQFSSAAIKVREAAGPATNEPRDPIAIGNTVRKAACKSTFGKAMQKIVGGAALGSSH